MSYNEPERNTYDVTEKGAVSVPVANKHVEIDRAVDSLESTVTHANNILMKILGDDSIDGVNPEKPTPTLIYILSETTGNLNDIEKRLHSVLDEIESQLF